MLRVVATLLLAAVPLAAAGSAGAAEPVVDRIAGTNRFSTAAEVAGAAFPDGAPLAYVATGATFADALPAGPLASRDGAPVLLARQAAIPEETIAALRALGTERAVILGGGRAIGSAAERQLEELLGSPVQRIAGDTRFETAAMVAGRFPPGVPVAYVANAFTFADALTGAAAAGHLGGPVLLVQREAVPPATARALERLAPAEVVVLGGPAVADPALEEQIATAAGAPVRRVAGADRFGTAAAVSRDTYPGGASTAYLATGAGHPDALAAGPLAARAGAPLLLGLRDCVPAAVLAEIDRLAVDRVVLIGGSAVLGPGAAGLVPCGFEATVVARGRDVPWDVAFTPDGRTFVTERDRGRLIELDAAGGATVAHTFAVESAGEGGLLGLAVSPTYAADGLLYAYLTTASDNRVVRFRPGVAGSEEVVVRGIPRASVHNGGRMVFSPDSGRLYIGTGDAGVASRAQDWGSLGGKILRVRPDGSVPSNNPRPGSPVWALGLRNVQGLAFRGGTLLATDLGPECDDEVNLVTKGGNYGWPDACGVTRPGAIPPIAVRQPPEASWSGAAVLEGAAVPAWEGDLFAAGLRGRRLWRFSLSGGRVTGAQQLLAGEFGRLRHAAQAPDGSLWLLTSNRDGRGTPVPGDDRIIRLAPPGR